MKSFSIVFSFFLCGVFFFLGCGRKKGIVNRQSEGILIICLGDSITYGYGVAPEESYPSLLGEKLDENIVNAGESGETSRDGLKRLEKDVLNKNPKLVIVEFGANDYLQKIPLKETFGNIDLIVKKIQEKGAMVVLMSVKVELLKDSYAKGLRKIAEKRGALFIPNILKDIQMDPKLRIDEIHPNAEGYKILSEKIYEKVKPLLNNQVGVH